jgi:hypothetical protein
MKSNSQLICTYHDSNTYKCSISYSRKDRKICFTQVYSYMHLVNFKPVQQRDYTIDRNVGLTYIA